MNAPQMIDAKVEKRFPAVKVTMEQGDSYGLPGTFEIVGTVVGTRLMVIGDRTAVSVPVGAGEITLHVPSENVEVVE